MADRNAINDALAKYCYGYDNNELSLVEEAFTADATMSLRIGDGDLVGPFEGRDAILGLMRDSLASQTDQRRHLTVNTWFKDESEDDATVVSYLLLSAVEDGKLTVLTSGVYTDKVVRDGSAWKIAERFLQLDAPY